MLLYVDCQNGISGDMMLAALVHLGLKTELLKDILAKAGIICNLKSWSEIRAAGPGYRLEVSWNDPQPLRYPADIAKIFSKLDISKKVYTRAEHILNALVEAEAYAHGITQDKVHFHEVGAIDTLVDILGVAWGLEQLHISELRFSALPMFRGIVECAHGRICLPAPATAYLMRGKHIFSTAACTELVTPTGAAIVHGLMLDYGLDFNDDFPKYNLAHVAMAMGTGYGSCEAPNGLRLWILGKNNQQKMNDNLSALNNAHDSLHNNLNTQNNLSALNNINDNQHNIYAQDNQHALNNLPNNESDNLQRQAEDIAHICQGKCEEIIVFETHLDHLTGEELGYAIEKLSSSENILDVLWLNGITKKNRPAGLLRIICLPLHIAAVSLDILKHTHTLGLRWQNIKRIVLPRKEIVDTSEEIKSKSYVLGGENYIRPECQSQKIRAENNGVGLPALRFKDKHKK